MSKRDMYRPLTKDSTTSKEKRKPLAQGRLVSRPADGADRPRRGVLKQGSAAGDDGVVTSASYPASQSHAKEGLAAHQRTSSPTEDSHSMAPRRQMPHASFTSSPKHVQPSKALELSDAESDLVFSPQRHGVQSSHDSSVLMIDASRQTYGPDTSEVDIELGHTLSPAKVICHKPSVVHSNLRNTGDVGEARKVQVDSMASINVLSYSDYTDPEAPRPPATFKAPMVIRENTIAGSPIDPRSSARLAHVDDSGTNIEPQEMTDYPASHMLHDHKTYEEEVECHGNSDSENQGDISDRSETSQEKNTSKTKKGSAPRFPASRYLQSSTIAAKAKKKGPIKATDPTIMVTRDTSKDLKPKVTGGTSQLKAKRTGNLSDLKPKRTNTSLDLKPKRTGHSFDLKPKLSHSAHDLKPKRTGDVKDLKPKQTGSVSQYRVPRADSKDSSGLSKGLLPKKTGGSGRTTPQRTGSGQQVQLGKKKGYATSTPTAPGSELSMGDLSSIPSNQKKSYHVTPEVVTNPGRRRVDSDNMAGLSGRRLVDMSHESRDSKASTSTVSSTTASDEQDTSQRVKKTKAPELTQLQLDLEYMQYLQWVYLESKSRQGFLKQEDNVMADLYAVSELVSEKMDVKADLELELMRMKHDNKVDEALELQEAGLNSVVPGLEQLVRQYSLLATALDTTRHQLPTKGIYIPDDEDQYNDQLVAGLKESEKLLGELSVMLRQEQPKVTAFSEAFSAVCDAAQEQVAELGACKESLDAATTLTIQDCSLFLQDIQLSQSST